MLPKIVKDKMTMEIQSLWQLYNNLIKNVLTQEITVAMLDEIDQAKPLHKVKSNHNNQNGINGHG